MMIQRKLLLACLLGFLLTGPVCSQTDQDARNEPSSPEVYLVTFGPGPVYWQRFGHNALWIRDLSQGVDVQYNFGYFDFEQENFLTRFIQGRMEYFVAALDPARELAGYEHAGRSIRLQHLNLKPDEARRLAEYLQTQMQPANRQYLYDYYLKNCSTRVRDAIDLALNGKLKTRSEALDTGLSFRDETRRLTVMDPWYYLGLQMGLGQPVNRTMTYWDAYFLPEWLANGVGQLSRDDGQALVSSDRMLYQGEFAPPLQLQPPVWRYLLWSLAPLAAFLLLGSLLRRRMLAVSLWLGVCGMVGVVLAGLWFLTDHEAAYRNASLLLFNPLFLVALLLMIPETFRPWAGITLAFLVGGGLLMTALNFWLRMWIPSGPEVLIFVLPAHLVCVMWIIGWSRERSSVP